MSEITTNSAEQLTKAENLQDVEVALQQIAETANESLAAALNAQIQVLKYVQSPKLYDSSFDLLFANVRKAIKMTDSSKERELIREKAVVMLNNYVFFMQAKIDYDTAVQRKEYATLMEDAVMTLGESVADIATAAATAGAGVAAKASAKVAIKKAVVDSFAKQMGKGEDGIVEKFVRWCNKSSALQQRNEEFLETLFSLFCKLEKHKKLIGHSNIISGLIERHAGDIVNHYMKEEAEEIAESTKKNNKNVKSLTFFLLLLFWPASSFLIWICRACSNAGTAVANWFRKAENEVVPTEYTNDIYWYILGFSLLLGVITYIVYFVRERNIEKMQQAYEAKYNEMHNNLMKIADAFEEGDEDYD